MKEITSLAAIAAACLALSCGGPSQPAQTPAGEAGVGGGSTTTEVAVKPATAVDTPDPSAEPAAEPVSSEPSPPPSETASTPPSTPPAEPAEAAAPPPPADATQAAWAKAFEPVAKKEWKKVGQAMQTFLDQTAGKAEAVELRVQALGWIAKSFKEQGQAKKHLAALPAVIAELEGMKDPKAASHDTLAAVASARFDLAEADLVKLEKYKLSPDVPADKLLESFKKLTDVRTGLVGMYMDTMAVGLPEWSIASIYRIGYCYETQAKIMKGMGLPKVIKKLPPDIRADAEKEYWEHIDGTTQPLLTEAKSYYGKAIDLAKTSGMENEWAAKAEAALEAMEAKPAETPAL